MAAGTAAALVPLLALWYMTGRYGRPRFLVPPWARGVSNTDRPPKGSLGTRVKSSLAGCTISLAVVVIGLGIIWLIAVPEVSRLWGLLAAVLGVSYIV